MIWKEATLITYVTAKDRLGNDIPTDVIENSQHVVLRHTPWTSEQILADTRDITRTEQRFVAPYPYSSVKDFNYVSMDNVLYKITETQDLNPRWSVLQVKVYKK